MKLVVLVLVSLLLASCGESGDDGDHAGKKPDPRPDTVAWTDGRGDMWAAKFAEDSSLVPHERRPSDSNGDIRRVVVAHRLESLVIKVQYVDLDLEKARYTVPLKAFLSTDMGLESEISVSWDGTAHESFVNIVTESGGVDCEAASATVDSEGNTASVRVPRSCLGAPRWVRVFVESEIFQSHNYEAEPAHLDSAMDAGFPAATKQDGALIQGRLSGRVYAPTRVSPSGRGETTLRMSDPRGDVVGIGGDAESFDEGSPTPQHTDADILSTEVEHTAENVSIRVEFARLVRDSKAANYRLGAELKTNAARWALEDESEGPGAQPRPVLYVGEAKVPCKVQRSTDLAHRTSTWQIPRTCLGGDPAWVRVSLALVTWQPHDVATLDDAFATGYEDSDTFSRPVFKP
jgi:hypothetical protein